VNGGESVVLETTVEVSGCSDLSGLQSLLQRASDGDESAVPVIREILHALPESVQWFGADLAHEAEQALIHAITCGNIAQREALIHKLALLRSELAGANPHPLERLLVDRVILCWLHTYQAELQYGLAENVPDELADCLQQQLDRTQRRLLASVKTLATVRRLAQPAMSAAGDKGRRFVESECTSSPDSCSSQHVRPRPE
jgi:hypothetical protein